MRRSLVSTEEAEHGANTDLEEFAIETRPTLLERLVALRALALA